MYNSDLDTKCEILGTLWVTYNSDAQDTPGWKQFFSWADVALPLSYMHWQNLATINEDTGLEYIYGTWEVFCQMLNIDSEYPYASLEECLNASPNYDLKGSN